MQVTQQGTGQVACTVAHKVADEATVNAADEVAWIVPRDVPRVVASEAMRIAVGEAQEGSDREQELGTWD